MMKKYIQPVARVFNLQCEGLVAFSANDRTPNVDNLANNFSNAFANDEEWEMDDEE